MVRPSGRRSRGRQRIEIRRIEDNERRQVTFSKRRSGLFKKASELSTLTGAHVAVVAFSEAGRAFAFGSPSIDEVLQRYAPLPAGVPAPNVPAAGCGGGGGDGDGDAHEDDEALESMRVQMEETMKLAAAEKARMDAVGEKVRKAMAGKRYWWEADVDALGKDDLPEFVRALERLIDNLRVRADELRSATLQRHQK